MEKVRLLDADLYVNFARTSVLTSMDDAIESFENIKSIQFVSTKEVKDEAYNVIRQTASEERLQGFFYKREKELIKVLDRLFKKTRMLDSKECPLMRVLQATSMRDSGEKSLISLMFNKYSKMIGDASNCICIVSNNQNDIVQIVEKQVKPMQDVRKFKPDRAIRSIYDFYLEIFVKSKIKRERICFFFFVSNIDARFSNQKMIQIFKEIT
jgi:hypothetical protein